MRKTGSIRSMSKEIGVSPSTISRVMNHPELVKESTRTAVFDYIQKHNLKLPKPNKSRMNTIGLTFSDPSSLFTAELITALERKIENTDYHLMLFNLRSRRDVYEYFMEHPESLRKIDALIISSSMHTMTGTRILSSCGTARTTGTGARTLPYSGNRSGKLQIR